MAANELIDVRARSIIGRNEALHTGIEGWFGLVTGKVCQWLKACEIVVGREVAMVHLPTSRHPIILADCGS